MKEVIMCFLFFFSGISHGPFNTWHYLSHVKHVDDDDDDDDEVVSAAIENFASRRTAWCCHLANLTP